MTNIFKKVRDAYAKQVNLAELEKARKNGDIKTIGISVKQITDEVEAQMFFNQLNTKQLEQEAKDHRYNEPKGKHLAPEEIISETIESTEIYSRAKELILNAQRKQVGYGLDKYPEPLNADTWTTVETIDHIIDESIDKLHYLVMLRLKLEQEEQPVEDPTEKLIKVEQHYGVDFSDETKIHIDNWVVTPLPITHDLEVEYTLRGEEPKKLIIKDYMLRDNDICDMDSLRYAVLEAIRNDRF